MKKVIMLFIVFAVAAKSKAQTFEGAFMLPGFAKQTPFVEVNLAGKKIYKTDYKPFSMIDAPFLSKNEALTLATMLLRDPKDFGLQYSAGNVIRSDAGFVFIFYSKVKMTWALDFKQGEDIRSTGQMPIRCYFVK